jgi:hypothetical protein
VQSDRRGNMENAMHSVSIWYCAIRVIAKAAFLTYRC